MKRTGRGVEASGDDITFPPTSGRFSGVLGLIVLLGIVGYGGTHLDGDFPLPVAGGALVGAVLVWAALLRPAVLIRDGHLVLRGMFSSSEIPLAAIDRLAIRQYLAVRAGGKRYSSPAVGQPRRQMARLDRGMVERRESAGLGSIPQMGFGVFRPIAQPSIDDSATLVEDQLRHRIEHAQLQAGVRPHSEESAALAAGVRRRPAVIEIVALVLALAVFGLSFLS